MSILLSELSKRFSGRVVIDRVSLEVSDGELFVLLGASGSGKSTVLRIIAGLSLPDSGTVVLNGRDVTTLASQERGVGFVFQNYSIFRHMTAGSNVEFGLRIRKVPPAQRRHRAVELLDLVGLGGLSNRYSHQLSGGQQQRVALARALAYSPRVLLLDEPFGALDAKIRGQLRRTLREIQRALQITTILVTHDQEEAFELADRMGVIERGHLLEVGRPENLYLRPQTFFVATFLGAGTILSGRCIEGKAQIGPIHLPIPPEAKHEEGAPVRVLVRPEQVILSSEPPHGLPVLGKGRVVEQSFAGALRRLLLKVPHLPKTRQLAPALPYGEEALLVEAVCPSDQPVDEQAWIGLRGWSILRQAEPRLLLYGHGDVSPQALGFARRLAGELEGSFLLLALADDAEDSTRLSATLKKRSEEEGLEVRVRVGDPADQVLNEQAEKFYDLILLGATAPGERVRLDATVQTLLQRTRTPLLFLLTDPPRLERILICTAVGEPGKVDIRVGGWLAGRLNAHVGLLHIARDEKEPPVYVQAHLERGVATLRGLDVSVECRIRHARTPAEGILGEAREGHYDLIVVGSHGPPSRSILGRDDVTAQIIQRADRPVLVVPEGSW